MNSLYYIHDRRFTESYDSNGGPTSFTSGFREVELADFKIYGENAVRDDERFMKNYLSGKYGAIPFVDFKTAVY